MERMQSTPLSPGTIYHPANIYLTILEQEGFVALVKHYKDFGKVAEATNDTYRNVRDRMLRLANKDNEAKLVYDSVKGNYHTWSQEEDNKLCALVRIHGLDYSLLARGLPTVSSEQIARHIRYHRTKDAALQSAIEYFEGKSAEQRAVDQHWCLLNAQAVSVQEEMARFQQELSAKRETLDADRDAILTMSARAQQMRTNQLAASDKLVSDMRNYTTAQSRHVPAYTSPTITDVSSPLRFPSYAPSLSTPSPVRSSSSSTTPTTTSSDPTVAELQQQLRILLEQTEKEKRERELQDQKSGRLMLEQQQIIASLQAQQEHQRRQNQHKPQSYASPSTSTTTPRHNDSGNDDSMSDEGSPTPSRIPFIGRLFN